MSTFAQAGMRWQPIIDYATWWSGNSSAVNAGVSPAHVGDYAAYAGAFAARYGDGGAFWAQHPSLPLDPVKLFEIWNEPDLSAFWRPWPNLVEYATMFLDARAAIKAVEPNSKVIIGGLISPAQSLPAMLAARPDLRGNVDGIGLHTYDPTARLTLASVANALKVDAATLGVPLYVNEWGWQLNPWSWQGATEAVRDAAIEQVTEQLGQNPSVADVEPYCWGCSDAFNIYGTPAATALAQGIAAAQSAVRAEATTNSPRPSAPGFQVKAKQSKTNGKHRKKHRRRHGHPRHRHRAAHPRTRHPRR
jgi:Cellulase (glycosyl hydrolase family 5)